MLQFAPATALPLAAPDTGIRLRLPPRDFADLQERRALSILRDLVLMLEDHESAMWDEMDLLAQQGRAGRQSLTRALRRQRTYLHTTRRMLKVMESAEARRSNP